MDVDGIPSTSTDQPPLFQQDATMNAEAAAMEAVDVDALLPPELIFAMIMSWRGTKYEVQILENDTVGDLKTLIWSLTSVPPLRQKLLGLVKGKLPSDEEEVVKLGLTQGKTKEFMLVGTPEGDEHKAEVGGVVPGDGASDKDVDYSAAASLAESKKAAQNVRNRRKLKEAGDALTIDIINPPRPGKKLLVLDLDYCILDTGVWKEANFNADFFARPFLHEFLKTISPWYDICIWSQTSWRWLETKLVELHILGEEKKGDYNVVFTLDRIPMFSVYSHDRAGKPFKHEVKALPLIWTKFPEIYSSANTIHMDDLSRNFAMNPENGLRVHAYRDSFQNKFKDRELAFAARYLLQLTKVDDFTSWDHHQFRICQAPLPEGVEDPVAAWKLPEDDGS